MSKRTGVLAAGAIAVAAFALGGCGGDETTGVSTGTLEVLLKMEGTDQDSNGGTLYLDGQPLGTVAVNIRRTDRLDEGIYVVYMAGIEPNCESLGANERNITIRAGQTSSVEFTFLCESTGGKDPGGGEIE